MISIRPSTASDLAFITATLTREFGSTQIWSRRRAFECVGLPTLIALDAGTPVGLSVHRFEADECELIALVATNPGGGVGSTLLESTRRAAANRNCRRLFLTTTNDNLDALRFYQRRGMKLAALHAGAMNHARSMQPSIPVNGHYNIPMRDDLELEYILQ